MREMNKDYIEHIRNMESMKCGPCSFLIAVGVDVVPSTLDSRVYHVQDVQKVPRLSTSDCPPQVHRAWISTEALSRLFSEEKAERHPAKSKIGVALQCRDWDLHVCMLYKIPTQRTRSKLQL
jgi:hypothetical protein